VGDGVAVLEQKGVVEGVAFLVVLQNHLDDFEGGDVGRVLADEVHDAVEDLQTHVDEQFGLHALEYVPALHEHGEALRLPQRVLHERALS